MKHRPQLFNADDVRLIAICLHEGTTPGKIAYYVYGISYDAMKSRLKTQGTSIKELLNNPIPKREY